MPTPVQVNKPQAPATEAQNQGTLETQQWQNHLLRVLCGLKTQTLVQESNQEQTLRERGCTRAPCNTCAVNVKFLAGAMIM